MVIRIEAPSAVSTQAAVSGGRLSALQVVEATIERIAALEPGLRAWQVFEPELARAQARGIDRRHETSGSPGGLVGVPLGVKDIFDTADLPTAYGSPIYKGARPLADAVAVATVRAAGAVVMGKTVTTEFAYFTPGPTANPWNVLHTPGGSSSGSAAAVASGMVPLAFGSQTAGSLIRPASYCGVFALKMTYGVQSLQGVKPFSHSLDTCGWLARDPDDLELMRCALQGQVYQPLPRLPVTRLRTAAVATHEDTHLDPGGLHTWQRGLDGLATAGLPLARLKMPESLAGLLDAQRTVMAYEAARSLDTEAREHPDLLSPAILTLLQTGRDTSDERYAEARALASHGRGLLADLMRDLDALIVPAAPGEAPAGLTATGDPVFSRVWTLLGLPCVNVPGLLGPAGLPVGLQLIGHPDRERDLLAVAAATARLLEAVR